MRPAQIDITELQAGVFLHVHRFFHGERRRPRLIQDPEFFADDFHFSGRNGGVNCIRAPQHHGAFGGDDIFRGKQLSFGMDSGISVGAKYDLRHAVAVAQVNKEHPAQIAAAMYPPHKNRALTRVGGA